MSVIFNLPKVLTEEQVRKHIYSLMNTVPGSYDSYAEEIEDVEKTVIQELFKSGLNEVSTKTIIKNNQWIIKVENSNANFIDVLGSELSSEQEDAIAKFVEGCFLSYFESRSIECKDGEYSVYTNVSVFDTEDHSIVQIISPPLIQIKEL